MSEALLVVSMVAVFVLAASARAPIGLSLALAAGAGGLAGGLFGLPLLRHLLEGSLGYLDAMLIIATATLFVKATELSGSLPALAQGLIRRFSRRPGVLFPLLAAVVMLPGMITGSSTAAVLTTGALVAPVLGQMGLTRERAGGFIAMAAIYGMLAPPVNIPAMLIGGGVDLPYVGLEGPLLLGTLPLALVTAWYLGWPVIRGRRSGAGLPLQQPAMGLTGEQAARVPDPSVPEGRGTLLRHALPWAVVAALMLGGRLWPESVPDAGLPLTFLIGAGVAWLAAARRFSWNLCARAAIDEAVPVLAIVTGVGMFIQVLTATGGRGWVVVGLLGLPAAARYLAMAVGIPLFGAVSAFGAASVLGVPFLLAFLGRSDIVTAAGLSMLAGLGDLMPPTALAGIFAAQVVGAPSYWRVLRFTLLPALLTAAAAVAMVAWARPIGALFFS